MAEVMYLPERGRLCTRKALWRSTGRPPAPRTTDGMPDWRIAVTAQPEKAQAVPGDLGGLVAEFRGRLVSIVVVCLVIGTMLGFWIGHSGELPDVIAGLAAGTVVAVGLFLLGFFRWRQLSVKVYSGGLVYQAKGVNEIWKWGEMEFFVLVEKREGHGAPRTFQDWLFEQVVETVVRALLPKAAKYRVSYELRRPGHKRQLTSFIRGHRQLGEMVEEFVTEVQLPVAQASFSSGNVVTFGKLWLGQDGLLYASAQRPQFLPLSALAGVSVSRYAVKVHQVGGKPVWLIPERSAVANATVLAGLAERIVAGRDLHDAGQAGDGA
jgi:hypothetical protein